MSKPSTLGELAQSEWGAPERRTRTVKDEMRANLLCRLESEQSIFPGIVGYDDSVVPQLVNAVLSRHNFILLGLRGQAKSRIVRGLIALLDEEVPILAGSEVNDNPFAPISKYGRLLVEEHGDRAPVAWVPRAQRYVEKLATPDVTIADIIGDVDPIKAARGGHLLSDELTIHYGLLPRANRGVFAINELPDLACPDSQVRFDREASERMPSVVKRSISPLRHFSISMNSMTPRLAMFNSPSKRYARGSDSTPYSPIVDRSILPVNSLMSCDFGSEGENVPIPLRSFSANTRRSTRMSSTRSP